jgi:TonB family protein
MATANHFELGLLPERKLDWRALVTSYSIVIFLILAVICAGLIWPEHLGLTHDYRITELIPLPSTQPKAFRPKNAPLRAKLLQRAPLPVLNAPRLVVPREVRMVHPPPAEVTAPKVVINQFQAPVLAQVSGGARMARLVHTGEFGSSAQPTLNVPIQKVQTGGFGDSEGIKGQGKPNARLAMASTGSFDLPTGPGQGNGTGGAKGISGTVASAGFGNALAQPGQGDGRSNGRGVQSVDFGAQEVAPGGAKQRQVDNGPPTSQVEITFKPKPVYTQEARELRLEGEVLVEVVFGANGQLHVIRVDRGLGHGLDQSAVAAANQMRFKPALRNGVPVDSTAIVHVLFELAY